MGHFRVYLEMAHFRVFEAGGQTMLSLFKSPIYLFINKTYVSYKVIGNKSLDFLSTKM